MNRNQILWLEGWIALGGAVYWYLPEQVAHSQNFVWVGLLWGCLCLVSIPASGLEKWAHRASSFFGFLLFTVEGILGMLGLTNKSGLLIAALFHFGAFVLSVAGKYKLRFRSHPKRSLEQMAEEALADLDSKNQRDGGA